MKSSKVLIRFERLSLLNFSQLSRGGSSLYFVPYITFDLH